MQNSETKTLRDCHLSHIQKLDITEVPQNQNSVKYLWNSVFCALLTMKWHFTVYGLSAFSSHEKNVKSNI